MVTVCDADSLFDTVFLEQLEGEFWRMPDGRRCLYDSPINTYRNLPECCLMTQLMEVSRCQFTLFSGGSFRPAQSNYSLTLGFAHELDYWDPSNTSEDFHTTLKAMAVTGSGSNVVVRVWSLILNDSVAGFTDRWTQAKRHMWGLVEEPVRGFLGCLSLIQEGFLALRFILSYFATKYLDTRYGYLPNLVCCVSIAGQVCLD